MCVVLPPWIVVRGPLLQCWQLDGVVDPAIGWILTRPWEFPWVGHTPEKRETEKDNAQCYTAHPGKVPLTVLVGTWKSCWKKNIYQKAHEPTQTTCTLVDGIRCFPPFITNFFDSENIPSLVVVEGFTTFTTATKNTKTQSPRVRGFPSQVISFVVSLYLPKLSTRVPSALVAILVGTAFEWAIVRRGGKAAKFVSEDQTYKHKERHTYW